ncbi:MAG: non-heme iron oxygenase ferredoxin subunit [Actinomycetota bacterium]|nr:non-heme iron oxygenase ferredoxin subunit [Actinomycetota bacterium]
MGQTKFLTWTSRGDSVPPSWHDALERLRTHDDARVVSTGVETVARASDVPEGEIRAFEVEGHQVAVANVQGGFYAFNDVCTHRQCPLQEGTLEGATVTCGCHGSQFDVQTGQVLRGPARVPAPTYEVTVVGDELRIRPRPT